MEIAISSTNTTATTTNNGSVRWLWNCYGACRSAHISVEVRLSSDRSPAADKDSVIQCLAHSHRVDACWHAGLYQDWRWVYSTWRPPSGCLRVWALPSINLPQQKRFWKLSWFRYGCVSLSNINLHIFYLSGCSINTDLHWVSFGGLQPQSLVFLLPESRHQCPSQHHSSRPVTASGLQLLTVLVYDILVAGVFLACRHLTKEAICFNETGSQSETTFFFCVRGWKSWRNLGNGATPVYFILLLAFSGCICSDAFKSLCLKKHSQCMPSTM